MEHRLDRLDDTCARLERLASLAKYGLGAFGTLIAAVFALGALYQRATGDIATLRADVDGIRADRAIKIPVYDAKLADVTRDVATIKNDVSWIRSALERKN